MCSTTKSKLHLIWLEVWWSLGSYQSMFHHAMRGDTLSHSIETIYDLWWSFGLTHPCSTTLWAPDHSTSIIMRQCKDKGHISHPQEKPQSTSTGGRGGRGSRWVHYIGWGWGGGLPNLDHIWTISVQRFLQVRFYMHWRIYANSPSICKVKPLQWLVQSASVQRPTGQAKRQFQGPKRCKTWKAQGAQGAQDEWLMMGKTTSHQLWLGGGFNIFLPLPGEMIQFD